jgi:hypothetical protein
MKTFRKWLENVEQQGRLVLFPGLRGFDEYPTRGVLKGEIRSLRTKDCIGNEPGKDFNYFKTGKSDKGPMKDYVENMIKAVRQNQKLPPIKAIEHSLLPGKYLVIDGNHRLAAFKIGGIDMINAEVMNPAIVRLAVSGSVWTEGQEPQSVSLDEAKNQGYDMRQYFNAKELAIPDNDEWVRGLRNQRPNQRPAPAVQPGMSNPNQSKAAGTPTGQVPSPTRV